ncbi:unnamed protein product [Paramecium pentaurelia]|uniref:Transmembrane protein n=1 Tax=Paramecium pentaurelia TaxID=43138 RepID=A0A8S1YLW7_9CILI|nr:unnamed protein product [Paramecium pentaurelia]
MQQVKYPQFDIQSSNQLENLQQQLIQNTKQDIKYLPVQPQYNLNLQQQQLVSLPYSKQINTQQNYYNLDQLPQSTNSYLLKDSDFLTQKFFLSSILGMFIFWTFLFVLIFFIMMILFGRNLYEHQNAYPYCFAASVIILIFLVKIGSMEKFRQTELTFLIYFGSIIAYTLTFFFIIASFSTDPSIEMSGAFIAGLLLIIPLFSNFMVTIILLMYVLIETKQFRYFRVFFFEFLCVLPFAIIQIQYIISLVIILPYTCLLINVLKQIQLGRFNLSKDQVLRGTLAAYYGIFVPIVLFD